MHAVEFTIKLGPDRTLSIPEAVSAQLPKAGSARVIILTEDDSEDENWRRAAYEQFARDDSPEDAAYDSYK